MSRVLPILFNTDMVEALEDGRKTVTRRVIKPQPQGYFEVNEEPLYIYDTDFRQGKILPPFRLGDILYVRERFCIGETVCGEEADGGAQSYVSQPGYNYIPYEHCIRNGIGVEDVKWRPSIHMPKECARIWLKVTGVRAERLWDITKEEAEKEGVTYKKSNREREFINDILTFSSTWNSTIKKADLPLYGWCANPWVWVIEFEECKKPEGE